MRRGFTLIELLVVITIIGIISVIALPTVLPALQHRQVSEAARLLQGALAGARDAAIHNNAPAGIRLLPDPAFTGLNAANVLDPLQPLAYNRIVPLEQPADYTEGLATINATTNYAKQATVNGVTVPCLVLEEAVLSAAGLPNSPAMWWGNIRVGDKLQLKAAGPWYTIVGPTVVASPEQFVNGPLGPSIDGSVPADPNALAYTVGKATIYPQFLMLVDGRDNNANGWTDEGFDGVDNDGDGYTDNATEWEAERWHTTVATNMSYLIQRRPSPSSGLRAVDLPSGVVIDATTWATTQERSRLPVNAASGYVDIMVMPNGSIAPGAGYSSPTSTSMAGLFYQFWLAAREDVVAPTTLSKTLPNTLPIGTFAASDVTTLLTTDPNYYAGPFLRSDSVLITLFGRTGLITATDPPTFQNPNDGAAYNIGMPFHEPLIGGR